MAITYRLQQIAHGLALLSACALSACSGGSSDQLQSAPVINPPASPAPPPPTPLSETDVVYGQGLLQSGTKDLLLDVYQPGGACTELRPFVIGIHGGGFVGGSKSSQSWIDNMDAVAERGFVGLSIDYRLVGDAPSITNEFAPVLDDFLAEADRLNLPSEQRDVLRAAVAAFEDTVMAIRWAEANAEERCLDIERFAIWGSSAGAITTLHVGHGLDEYGIDRPDPLVLVDYWGGLLLDGLVDANGPPFMIVHGTNDRTVVYEENAVPLAAEADAAGLPYAFYTMQDAPHGFRAIDPAFYRIDGEAPRDVTVTFIEDHLTNGSPLYDIRTIIPMAL
ncbi:MAG: hypothetical protein AAF830_05225 [Pseudomonadota bacterium]